MEIYEKYLVSEKREFDKMKLPKMKKSMDKLIKVIKSSQTLKQLDTARRMAGNFITIYGDKDNFDFIKRVFMKEFTNSEIPGKSTWVRGSWRLDKIMDIIDNKGKKIKHEMKQFK